MPSAIPSGEEYFELTKQYGEYKELLPAPGVLNTYHAAGDVVYLSVLGNRLILLGSYEATSELLNKRASNYSDRPQPVMTGL